MMDLPKEHRLAWPTALAAATLAGSLAAACMMPFVALAVLAAATLPQGRAAATIVAIWAANQALGFTVLGYPATGYAAAWGAALGAASLTAGLVTRAVLRGRRDLAAAPLLLAFCAAFVGYEALLYGFAAAAGGTETFAPEIVLSILTNDAMWFAGLCALHVVLTGLAPRWFGPVPTFGRA